MHHWSTLGTHEIASRLVFYHGGLTLGIDYTGWMQASSAICIKRDKKLGQGRYSWVMKSFLHALHHISCEQWTACIILWITYPNNKIPIIATSFYLMVRFNTSSHVCLWISSLKEEFWGLYGGHWECQLIKWPFTSIFHCSIYVLKFLLIH